MPFGMSFSRYWRLMRCEPTERPHRNVSDDAVGDDDPKRDPWYPPFAEPCRFQKHRPDKRNRKNQQWIQRHSRSYMPMKQVVNRPKRSTPRAVISRHNMNWTRKEDGGFGRVKEVEQNEYPADRTTRNKNSNLLPVHLLSSLCRSFEKIIWKLKRRASPDARLFHHSALGSSGGSSSEGVSGSAGGSSATGSASLTSTSAGTSRTISAGADDVHWR